MKVQATLLPALSDSCEMQNRDQQIQFLQPIHDSDRQGERKPGVFLKAKVIQASSQLNLDRDKIFQFSGQQLPISKFGQDNLPKIFRFGTHQELTPTLNILQIALAKTLRYRISQLLPRLVFHLAIALPLSILFHSSSDLERTIPHMNLKLTYLPLQIHGKYGVAPLLFPGNREEPTTAMNSTSNLGGNPGLAHIQYPSAGDREDDTTDCAPPVLEQLSRAP